MTTPPRRRILPHRRPGHARVLEARRLLEAVHGWWDHLRAEATAAASDRAGTATILGALRPMLGRLPGSIAEMRRHGPALTRITGAGNQRGVALALHAWLAPRLDPLGRCPTDACPACREGEPCPLDTWRTGLVPSALGPKASQVNAFWNTTGQASAAAKGAGRGYVSMRRTAPGLADVVLRACLEFHRASGDRLTAALLAEQVWQQARCSDPAVTETRATTMAADRHAPIKLVRLPREPRFLRAG
jgi:hypothetical protein